MINTMKELDEAFKMLETIPVSHGSVEVMATAKNKLRRVYADLKKMTKEGDNNE